MSATLDAGEAVAVRHADLGCFVRIAATQAGFNPP